MEEGKCRVKLAVGEARALAKNSFQTANNKFIRLIDVSFVT